MQYNDALISPLFSGFVRRHYVAMMGYREGGQHLCHGRDQNWRMQNGASVNMC